MRCGGALPRSQVGLDLGAVDRGARPRRVRRIHGVEGALRRRHVIGRLDELDYDRGALVRVVENLDALGRDVHGWSPAGLNLVQTPRQVIRIDVGEPDHACVHGSSSWSSMTRTYTVIVKLSRGAARRLH